MHVILTFFSPSGYEVRKNYDLAERVVYLPADSPANARYFIDLIKPQMAIFIKYEFWHHYLTYLKQAGIPVFSVSSIFREGQIFFRWYGGFQRKILRNFDHLFVQDEGSKSRLANIGITNVTVSGDTRFDRVGALLESHESMTEIGRFARGRNTLVAGSTWPADIRAIKRWVNELSEDWAVIIAPHEVNERNIEALQVTFTGALRYTDITENTDSRVLIIDNMGMLSRLYRYANVAYVGGAFGAGLHNILEPAVYGCPVIFGNKNFRKFKEATDLQSLGGAIPVSGENDFISIMWRFKEEDFRKKAGKLAQDYVLEQRGATSIIMEHIKTYLE